MDIAICPSHDSTVTVFDDSGLKYFFKTERYTRKKRDMYNPVSEKVLEKLFKNLSLIITNKYYREPDNFSNSKTAHYNHHHKMHAACAFYNSGFENSLVMVIDRNGAQVQEEYIREVTKCVRECETVFIASYPNKFEVLDRYFWGYPSIKIKLDDRVYKSDNFMSVTKIYETATVLIGENLLENGKTMGLSAYGRDLPFVNFFDNGVPNQHLFKTKIFDTPGTTNQNGEKLLFKEFSYDLVGKMTQQNYQLYADYAFQVQKQTQEEIARRVDYYVNKTGIKKVCIVGGYGLNVVTNGYLVKMFPDVEFFFEPLADDSGVALGLSYLIYRNKTLDNTITPLKNTFFHGTGQDTSEEQDKYGHTCTIKDIVKLIREQKTVAVYNGMAEAGPRALGHRSILFDATNPNAKAIVNRVKKREWYRPFAAMVLEEDFGNYFETMGLKNAEFMTISFAVKDRNKIPGVTHVDGSCRAQTVNKSISHIFDLLTELKLQTGTSVLLNTSLNLAGEPLVETVNEAIKTFYNSELDALWFPSVNKVLLKTND